MTNVFLDKLLSIHNSLKEFDSNKIALCAAENRSSDFIKSAIADDFAELYAMGNLTRDVNSDFIGSRFIFDLFDLLTEICHTIFGSRYADARTLSGMNCDLMVFMSVLNSGDKVLLTTPEQGGHSSVPLILTRLGIAFDEIPYGYDNFQIDYDKTNNLLKTSQYAAVIFCQSDLLQPPDVEKLHIPENCLVLYDGTQTLGLIAGKVNPNPLKNRGIILMGGTHKTIPGPTCGLILCNDETIIKKIDTSITPDFLRHVQPDKIVKLILAMIEQINNQFIFQKMTPETANIFGRFLENYGFNVAKIGTEYTNTHQLFIKCSECESNIMYNNAMKYNVTLNKKHKPLFGGYGIRLGVQEIVRYGWNEKELDVLAQLIYKLNYSKPKENQILELRRYLLMKRKSDIFNSELVIE